MLECQSKQVKPKYIDFGLSKILLHGQEDEDRFGTLAYCSPEILIGNKHTHMTDIWSLGIILHVILSSCFPYLSNDKNQTKKNIIAGKLNFSRSAWDRVSRSGKDLIVRIL
jgi:serine/threonine protein kinase